MSGRSQAAVLAGMLCAAGLLLSGCAGSGATPGSAPGATTPTPAASSPTAKPSPTLTPPTFPEAAKKPTTAGAEAFVRYFWDAYNYGYAALETKQLDEVSSPDCNFCRNVSTGVGAPTLGT